MDLRRLDWILVKAQETDLSDFEARFINDFTERRECYGDRIHVSEKQEEVLERIAAKA